MKRYLMLIFVLPMLLVAACQPISEEEATAQYCQDLEVFQATVDTLTGLTADDSIEEAEVALQAVDDAYDEVRSSAYMLADARVDDLEEAYEDLDDALRDIEEGQSLSDAAASVQTEVENVKAAYVDVYSFSCE